MAFGAKTLSVSVSIAMAALLSCPITAGSEYEKVPQEVLEKVKADGTVLVLVGLQVPWQREGLLSDSAVLAQREAIEAAQHNLLAQLSGTVYKVVRQYQNIPGLALEVGADALAVLSKSHTVTNVLPDRPAIPAANQSAPSGMPLTATPDPLSTSPSGKVPKELFDQAENTGTVLVLVGLKAPWRPEEPLSQDLLFAQRKAIAAAQEYLLVELAHTRYKITRLYTRIPGIALEVGLDALRVLGNSAVVINVLQDRPPQSALQSAPSEPQ
jgi:hypothetical protein